MRHALHTVLQQHRLQERRPLAAVAVEGLGAQTIGHHQHQPLGRCTAQIGLRPESLDDRRLEVDDEYRDQKNEMHQHTVNENIQHFGGGGARMEKQDCVDIVFSQLFGSSQLSVCVCVQLRVSPIERSTAQPSRCFDN